MVRIILVMAILLIAPHAMSDSWKAGRQLDEFDGDDIYAVMIGGKTYPILTLYCSVKSPRLSLLYYSNEKLQRGDSKRLPMSGKIYIKVDDRPVREIYGTIERSRKRTWAGRSKGIDRLLARELALAKSRISVALGSGGFSQLKEFRARFKPAGSAKPLYALLSICK